MVDDIGRFQLWSEVDFAELLSPIAIGASFEGLADLLIARISDVSTRPNTFPNDLRQGDERIQQRT